EYYCWLYYSDDGLF
nr:immunoglobulin light chain junction region [Macaca mulatta]MOW18497.1 immunoglobulin light chain junction region [Macaca mulatta]